MSRRAGASLRGAAGVRAREEAGFTAVELLVVMAILGLVMAMVTSAIVTTMQGQRRQLERLEALNEVKTALQRVTRDVRGANPLVGPLEPDRIEMEVVRLADDRTVVFRVDGDELLMDEVSPTGTFTHTLATGLDPGTAVFRYLDPDGVELSTPAPVAATAAVEIRLRRVLPEETDIEFGDRITIRNAGG